MKQIELLKTLRRKVPKRIQYKPAPTYYWSPKDSTVFFQSEDDSEVGSWTLLHETCHGILQHKSYHSDFELIKLEMEAWEEAKELAKQFDIVIDEDHIQDCLDSYRDWQYKRSICPYCELGGVQTDTKTYTCLFCLRTWHVSKERFFRPYRRKTTI